MALALVGRAGGAAGLPDHTQPLQAVVVVEPHAADDNDAVRPRRRKAIPIHTLALCARYRLGTLPALDIGDRLDVEDQVLGARRACHVSSTLGPRCDIGRKPNRMHFVCRCAWAPTRAIMR